MKNAWTSLALGAALIILLTIVAYIPAMRGGFIWDDDFYVTENQTLRSVGGLGRIWVQTGATSQYYPLTFTSFWVEYHLWKLHPLGYHLTNILLHALNAVLLWCVLRRLKIPASWWAAAIFALHPVMVESVAWITERKNVLSCLFYMLAMLAYLRFRPLTDQEASHVWEWRFYPLVFVLFLCALLSKTVTCSLPAVLVLLLWWKTGRLEKRDALALAPLFVLGAALGFMTAWLEKYHVGAGGEEWTLSIAQRCSVAGRALWFYAGKLFWPRQLAFIYPRWEINASAVWQYSFPFAASVVLIALWSLRLRIGKGPLVAVLFFAGTLAPALGFFDVFPFRYSFVADHFQYLACIGLITLGVSSGAAIFRRAGRRGRDLGALAGAAVLLLLGASTWRQTHIYYDLETLWRDTLAKTPDAWLAHNNLGTVLEGLGNVSEAKGHYEQALRLKPDYAEAHYNLGGAFVRLGKLSAAIEQYEQALRIAPDFAEAHYNLGDVLAQLGKVSEAIEQYEQGLQIKPNFAKAHYKLGGVLARLDRVSEAIEQYEQALRLKPDYAEAHYSLGVALEQTGKTEDAIGHYEQALRLKPDHAGTHNGLGKAFLREGNAQGSLAHFEQALKFNPDSAEVQNNLAWVLALLTPADGGDPVRAVTLAERACKLTGNRVAGYLDTLSVAYAAAGRFDEAIASAQKAIELAHSVGQRQLVDEIQTHLELYRGGNAYRPPIRATISPHP